MKGNKNLQIRVVIIEIKALPYCNCTNIIRFIFYFKQKAKSWFLQILKIF